MRACFGSLPDSVTFRWKDRSDHNRSQELTLPGVEFVRRYLRHVLPRDCAPIRYYGFCHPTAKANRLRIQIHSGMPFDLNSQPSPNATPPGGTPLAALPNLRGPDAVDGIYPATLQDPSPTTRPSCP